MVSIKEQIINLEFSKVMDMLNSLTELLRIVERTLVSEDIKRYINILI